MPIKPKISIVMPAYNVEKYIDDAIKSVLEQTYDSWELVIVDDCSLDNTWLEIDKYQDNRIIKIQRDINSGSVYIPRCDAIKAAKGEWIVNLDADDYIEPDYLRILLEKAIDNNIEICTPQMILVDEKGNPSGTTIPASDFDFERVYRKKEAYNLTVPVWKIGMNGALAKKELWEKAISLYPKTGKRVVHDDENLGRIALCEANGVSASKAKYYMRYNPTSVTRGFSLKSFVWMKSNIDLKIIAKERFGENSKEYRNVIIYDYNSYKSIFFTLRKNILDKETLVAALRLLKIWYNKIDWSIVVEDCRGIKAKIYRSFKISLLYIFLRHPRRIYFGLIWMMLVNKVQAKIRNNKYYAWYVTRKKREKNIREKLKTYYRCDDINKSCENAVICIYDGVTHAGGIADRLKGIIGTYHIAKKKGMQFKLYFKEPFPLEDFFVPNLYDWKIDKSNICLDKSKVNIIVLDSTQDSNYQLRKQQKYLERTIKNTNKQIHVYTNAGFSYNLNYAELFYELFKPSERLRNALERQISLIGTEYISVSCRFLDLLGDFNETYGYGEALSELERELLLTQINDVIVKLHNENPRKKIVVNSDSITFLNLYKYGEYTCVIPGNVTHIDAKQDEYFYEKYEKTFLDFMVIANAEKVYLIKSDKMHKSGYPYAASRINEKSFELIKI